MEQAALLIIDCCQPSVDVLSFFSSLPKAFPVDRTDQQRSPPYSFVRGTEMFSSSNKPYSAITVQIEQLTSELYEVDDLGGIVDVGLVEVVRLQISGPSEAARAIRKKLKYGSVHKQLRALTILDVLIGNAGPRFQRGFADEALVERLLVAARDPISNEEVRRKCQQLFNQWAIDYKSTPGMERIATMYKQLPQRKKPTQREHSRVLKETESEANGDPFGTDAAPGSQSSVTKSRHERSSSAAAALTTLKAAKPKPDKSSKEAKVTKFNLGKEKPNLLKNIAASSVASINLMNALRSFDREKKQVSEDQEIVKYFNECKQLRRKIMFYIQRVESDEWIGSLIHANEELVNALMTFEVLDKGADDDSDSDQGTVKPDMRRASMSASAPRPGGSAQGAFAGLTIESKKSPPMPPSHGKGKARIVEPELSEGDEWEDDDESNEEADENDPFADRNAV